MPMVSRRDFLATAGSFALTAAIGGDARAAMGPNDKFDLVIKGGDVLDPSQSLRGKRDIGIRFGVIEAVEADIPAARALRVLDAAGKLVTPGLVDLHSHVYPYGSAIGIPADELVANQCTTTCVSAGDAGANNFAAFRRYHRRADAHAALRLRAHRQYRAAPASRLPSSTTSISRRWTPAAKAIAENADIVLGVKVRMSENVIAKHGIEPLKRAIAACEQVGHAGQGDVPHRRRRDARADVADPRPAAAGRHPHPCLFGRAQHRPAPSPTSCRTAGCCRRRSPPSSAA